MRPIYVTVVGSTGGPGADGNSQPIPMDTKQAPFNVSIGCIATGTVTYSVQYTYDDPSIAFGAGTNWFNLPLITTQTATIDGNLSFPVTAVRSHLTAGTGTVIMSVIQGWGGS